MIKVINSRYNEPRVLYQLSEKEWLIFGDSNYLRFGEALNGGIDFIDFEGGPFISVGWNCEEIESIVEKIEPFKQDVFKLQMYKITIK